MMDHRIIGIVGPSCSGKSTLAREVARVLGAPLLQMDGRYVKGYKRPIVQGYESFEQPGQYDSVSLLQDLHLTKSLHPVIVVEGFLLFCYPELEAMCTHAFYLHVPHDELVRRRLARVAAGGDQVWGPNGGNPNADAGWHAHGREEWERFGAPQASLPGIRVLDGLHPIEDSVKVLLSYLKVDD
jgi:uridine kinase